MAGQRELARQVRTGLTVIQGNKNEGSNPKKTVNELDKLYYRKPIRQHVKEFGALFAAILLTISAVRIYRDRPVEITYLLVAASFVFIFLGYKAPAVLHPFWKAWMKFAQILGGVMTVLLLGIAWAVVLMPVSLIMRTLRVKVMNMDFKKDVATYWEDRKEKLHDFKLLDRQF